jgi:hypothetical protein
VLGGFVADLANGQARYSVTSAFGMLAALLNWAFLLYFKGPTASTRYSFGAEAAAAAQAAQAADLSGPQRRRPWRLECLPIQIRLWELEWRQWRRQVRRCRRCLRFLRQGQYCHRRRLPCPLSRNREVLRRL